MNLQAYIALLLASLVTFVIGSGIEYSTKEVADTIDEAIPSKMAELTAITTLYGDEIQTKGQLEEIAAATAKVRGLKPTILIRRRMLQEQEQARRFEDLEYEAADSSKERRLGIEILKNDTPNEGTSGYSSLLESNQGGSRGLSDTLASSSIGRSNSTLFAKFGKFFEKTIKDIQDNTDERPPLFTQFSMPLFGFGPFGLAQFSPRGGSNNARHDDELDRNNPKIMSRTLQDHNARDALRIRRLV